MLSKPTAKFETTRSPGPAASSSSSSTRSVSRVRIPAQPATRRSSSSRGGGSSSAQMSARQAARIGSRPSSGMSRLTKTRGRAGRRFHDAQRNVAAGVDTSACRPWYGPLEAGTGGGGSLPQRVPRAARILAARQLVGRIRGRWCPAPLVRQRGPDTRCADRTVLGASVADVRGGRGCPGPFDESEPELRQGDHRPSPCDQPGVPDLPSVHGRRPFGTGDGSPTSAVRHRPEPERWPGAGASPAPGLRRPSPGPVPHPSGRPWPRPGPWRPGRGPRSPSRRAHSPAMARTAWRSRRAAVTARSTRAGKALTHPSSS